MKFSNFKNENLRGVCDRLCANLFLLLSSLKTYWAPKNCHVFNTALLQFEQLLEKILYLYLSQDTLEINLRNWVKQDFLWRAVVEYSIWNSQLEINFWFHAFQRFSCNPGGIHLLKIKKKKKIEQRQWRQSGVFIVNLNIFHTLLSCFYS